MPWGRQVHRFPTSTIGWHQNSNFQPQSEPVENRTSSSPSSCCRCCNGVWHALAGNGGFGSVALASKMWPCGNRLSGRWSQWFTPLRWHCTKKSKRLHWRAQSSRAEKQLPRGTAGPFPGETAHAKRWTLTLRWRNNAQMPWIRGAIIGVLLVPSQTPQSHHGTA